MSPFTAGPLALFILVHIPISILLLALCYFFGIRPNKKGERCTEKTTGTVIGPSLVTYNDTIRVPSVEYIVDGRRYTVTGPHFKSVVSKNFSSPFRNPVTEYESNLTSRDDLPERLVVNSSSNSFISISQSPLMEMFPVGTEVDVYYNPNRPKEAYVIRYVQPFAWVRFLIYGFTAVWFVGNLLAIGALQWVFKTFVPQ